MMVILTHVSQLNRMKTRATVPTKSMSNRVRFATGPCQAAANLRVRSASTWQMSGRASVRVWSQIRVSPLSQ